MKDNSNKDVHDHPLFKNAIKSAALIGGTAGFLLGIKKASKIDDIIKSPLTKSFKNEAKNFRPNFKALKNADNADKELKLLAAGAKGASDNIKATPLTNDEISNIQKKIGKYNPEYQKRNIEYMKNADILQKNSEGLYNTSNII